MNLLSQIMSEEANEGAWLGRFIRVLKWVYFVSTQELLQKQQQSAAPRGGMKFVVTTNVTTNGQVRTKKPLRASDTEGYRGVRGTSGRARTYHLSHCLYCY